jgi:hypothetical protein
VSASSAAAGATIVAPVVPVAQPPKEEGKQAASAFALAEQISALLKGASNKTTRQALEMVASLNGLRVISADRPIGTTTAGVAKATPAQQKTSGKKSQKAKTPPPAPAAWKQTPEAKALGAAHTQLLSELKGKPDEDPEKKNLLRRLRDIEGQIKDLRTSKSGN